VAQIGLINRRREVGVGMIDDVRGRIDYDVCGAGPTIVL